ncbi:TlpA family protein disulfide reductase [Archangium lansingense]|uniref:Redoxin domain-containing protein n=1 Tax=Archangium lansingense TaxID=2995310 RepID=A0ABT4ABZ1_9BACT|nr:redoxin domain-containing protein [Archangium lansinium]MCY1079175.1 redoxin domain-containing protein [Archangium lansinium]
MNWRITASFVVLCLGLLAVLAKGFGSNPREVPFMLKGQAAPPFTLRALDSGMRVSSEQLKGRPMVINFWASWCGPCKMEHPVLEWGAREFGQQAQFMGVVFEDTEENAKQFLSQMGASFPQLIDVNSGVAVSYGVAGVPETYFVDAQGIILGKHVGPIDPQSLAEWMQKLSAGTATAKQ